MDVVGIHATQRIKIKYVERKTTGLEVLVLRFYHFEFEPRSNKGAILV